MSPGPPPKHPSQRRRRNVPAAGEWVELHELDKPVLPPLPGRSKAEGPWSSRTRALWEAWRRDPATGQYTAADIAYAVMAAYIAEDYHRSGAAALAAELRIRMDGLGLTAKGKRALRWRVAEPAEVVAFPPPARAGTAARRRRLSAIDPALNHNDEGNADG